MPVEIARLRSARGHVVGERPFGGLAVRPRPGDRAGELERPLALLRGRRAGARAAGRRRLGCAADQDPHSGDHQQPADRSQELLGREPAGQARADHRARGSTRRRPSASRLPVDALGRVSDHARHAHADAHGEVGAHRPLGRLADVAQQRRHPQGPEDQPHQPAQQPDQRPDHHGRADVELLAGSGLGRPRRPQQVDAEVEEGRPDHAEQDLVRDRPGGVSAHHGAGHRRRRHPPEQPPVHPSGADVGDRRRGGRDARDADVRAGPGRRAGGRGEHGGQPDVPQHEAGQPAREGHGEAPRRERCECDRVGGQRRTRTVAPRAMVLRSERTNTWIR